MDKIKNIKAETLNANTIRLTVELSSSQTCADDIHVDNNNSHHIPTTVHFINDMISPILIGLKPTYHKELDKMIEDLNEIHNQNKKSINIGLRLSLLLCKIAAQTEGLKLSDYIYGLQIKNGERTVTYPSIIYVILNSTSKKYFDFKELSLIPARFKSLEEGLKITDVVVSHLKNILEEHGYISNAANVPNLIKNLPTNADAFELVDEAIHHTHYKNNYEIYMGCNCDATSWYTTSGKYTLRDNIQESRTEDLLEYYTNVEKEYPQLLIESPLATTNWEEWSTLNNSVGDSSLISISKELFQTAFNLKKAISREAASAITLDLRDIRTVTELVELASLAKKANWKVIIENNSGIELNDSAFECSIGVDADFYKLNYFNNPNLKEYITTLSHKIKEYTSAS